jgi:hypothetical protein
MAITAAKRRHKYEHSQGNCAHPPQDGSLTVGLTGRATRLMVQRSPAGAGHQRRRTGIMAPVSAFRGFSPEAIQFLHELEDNNNRDWFKANRARYDEHLVTPATALGEDLAELGRPRLFRP